MILLGILDQTFKYGTPSTNPAAFATFESTGGHPPCYVFDSENGKYGYGLPMPGAWCVPVIYAPNTARDVQDVMGIVAARNGFSVIGNFTGDPEASGAPSEDCDNNERSCLLGFATVGLLKQWHNAHNGRASYAVVFGDTTEDADGTWDEPLGMSIGQRIVDSLPADNVKYEIWYNWTTLIYKWYGNAGLDPLGAYTGARAHAAPSCSWPRPIPACGAPTLTPLAPLLPPLYSCSRACVAQTLRASRQHRARPTASRTRRGSS